MTTKASVKTTGKQPAKPAKKPAIAAAPVALPPVADVAPAVTDGNRRSSDAAPSKPWSETISDIREAVSPARSRQKGRPRSSTIKDMGKHSAHRAKR